MERILEHIDKAQDVADTGFRESGWRVHCPTLGIYWTREIEGHFWQPAPFNGSFARAYALGAKAMAEVGIDRLRR